MKTLIKYASELGAKLDSCVFSGGGTDDTEVLQNFLDKAKDGKTHICLVMDGAALISGIKVYSNTTIRCIDDNCGFYLKDCSDCPVITNGNHTYRGKKTDCNIMLNGGVYNQNALKQKKEIKYDDDTGYWGEKPVANIYDTESVDYQTMDMVVCLLFCGVSNLKISGITIRNQRNFAGLFRNWEHVVCDNILIDLPDKMTAENQDGLHFHGPGKYLTMHNIRGNSGDDFIALAPDEVDWVSDITDVLIDGVQLEEADQGIRMLCCHEGRLDRVVIKNVTGTYRSYGFFINPFTSAGVKEGAGYGNIVIDTVNMMSTGVDYDYTENFLFRVGGRVEALAIKNIQNVNPYDSRYLVDIGLRYCYDTCPYPEWDKESVIGSLLIDGINSYETESASEDTEYIRVHSGRVHCLTVKNVNIVRDKNCGKGGKFMHICKDAQVENLNVSDIYAESLSEFIYDESGKTGNVNVSNALVKTEDSAEK